jgi:hypothetical protein
MEAAVAECVTVLAARSGTFFFTLFFFVLTV